MRIGVMAAAILFCAAATTAVGTFVRSAGAAEAAHLAGLTTAGVLVNQPPGRICVGKKFQIGVWYQQSGGSHRYRVDVYNPRGVRVFHRHGRAPSSHWRFWKVRAKMAGKYRTVYWGHFKHPAVWTPYRVTTRARSC